MRTLSVTAPPLLGTYCVALWCISLTNLTIMSRAWSYKCERKVHNSPYSRDVSHAAIHDARSVGKELLYCPMVQKNLRRAP